MLLKFFYIIFVKNSFYGILTHARSKIYAMKAVTYKKDRFYSWASTKIASGFAPLWLFFIYLTELVHCVPLDPIWVLFSSGNKDKKINFIVLSTLASVLTAVAGYCLGLFLWDFLSPYVLGHLISRSFFEKIVYLYQQYEAIAVALGAFIPFPLKVITISAGVCKASFLPFIFSVLIGRVLRFFMLDQVIKMYGEKIQEIMRRYFSHTVIAVLLKIMLACLLLWWI